VGTPLDRIGSRPRREFSGPFQLDDIAVRVPDIDRGPHPLGAISLAHFAPLDAGCCELGAQGGFVERCEPQRDVVHVPPRIPWGCATGPAQRASDIDEVDQRCPSAQLHEPERLDPALLAAAQHSAVEADRALEVAHAQHDVIDAADLDRTHTRKNTAVDLCRASAHARAPMTGGRTADDLYGLRVREVGGAPQSVSACPVCRATAARPRFAVEKVDAPVVVCEGCGLARFEPMPDAAAIAAFYPDDYYGTPGVKFHPIVERAVRWVGARHVSFLALGLAPGSRVLDVGCGRGVVLGALADRGLEVHGVEMSAAAARGADPRARVRIAPRLAEVRYPGSHFDQVLI